MKASHPPLLLRLERGMDETSMLERIEYIHTRLLVSCRFQYYNRHPPTVKLQLFSHISKAPLELTSRQVTDALLRTLEHVHVDLDFDFVKDTPELSRLFQAFRNSAITIQSIRMVGIAHHPASIWDFIASNVELKRIHVTIRANETSIHPLCQALQSNQSLEMISICCYHKNYILDDTLWHCLQDHSTMTTLHLVAMDHSMLTLVSKLVAKNGKLLSPRLKDLQLSSLLGGALTPPAETDKDGVVWVQFMRTLTNQTPHLQRLGLYNMQSLTTPILDDMLCHLSPNLQYLDLQGNYFIQSIYFPKWYETVRQRPVSGMQQLRKVNIGPQWLSYESCQPQEMKYMIEYLSILFAKHFWLYQLGGDLESLLERIENCHCNQNKRDVMAQDKVRILTLADWNRSGSRHYARQMHSQDAPIPIALWPLILKRMCVQELSIQRQASVVHMALQESAAHLLAMERSSNNQ